MHTALNSYDLLINTVRVGGGNQCCSSGSSAPSFMDAAVMGLSIFAGMYQQASSKGTNDAMSNLYAQIPSTCLGIVNSYPQKIATAVTSFNVKYSNVGIKIDSSGNVSKSYAQAKADIEQEIKDYKALGTDDKGNNTDAVKDYQQACNEYKGLQTSLDSYNTAQTKIDSFKSEHGSEVNTSTEPATANKPEASAYAQFANAKKGEKPEDTYQYKQELNKRTQLANEFNQLKTQQKQALNGKTIDQLKEDTKAAKTKMEEAAKATVSKDSKTTCSTYKSTLDSLEAKLNGLGSEAEFTNAVNQIKADAADLEDAKGVISAKNDLENAQKSVKNTRNKGIWNRIFKKSSSAHKTAKKDMITAQSAYQGVLDSIIEKRLLKST